MDKKFFLIADVLGFSAIVENSTAANLEDDIGRWLSLVKFAQEQSEIGDNIQLISDTLFANAPNSADGLKKLVRLSKCLLDNGTKQSLLVRGAITFGPLTWGTLTYGKAVLTAHRIEQAQDWIGICCEPSIPYTSELWGPDGLVCYPTPFKDGPIILHPNVVWEVPDPEALVRASLNFPLVKEGEALKWQWRRRLRNTINFRQYLDTMKSLRSPEWHIFQGSQW